LGRLDLFIFKALVRNGGAPPGSPVLRSSFRSMAKELGLAMKDGIGTTYVETLDMLGDQLSRLKERCTFKGGSPDED